MTNQYPGEFISSLHSGRIWGVEYDLLIAQFVKNEGPGKWVLTLGQVIRLTANLDFEILHYQHFSQL